MISRIAASLLVLAGALAAQQPAAAAGKAAYQHRQLYPLGTCVVSGEQLGADAVTFEAGGRTFRTCCEKCMPKVEKAPAAFVEKLDAAIVAAQLPNYPLDTCVISGKKLGSMGAPVQLVLDGTLVQLCCSGCTKKAVAKAGEMVQKVRDAAFAAQDKAYPLGECVVSGEKLDKDAVSVLFGTQLVKFCRTKCVGRFEKDPAPFLQKLTAAAKKTAPATGKAGATAGGCCEAAEAKPAEKAKDAAGACECCEGGCAGAANAKPADKKMGDEKKASPGGDCCEPVKAKVPAKGEAKGQMKGDAKGDAR